MPLISLNKGIVLKTCPWTPFERLFQFWEIK